MSEFYNYKGINMLRIKSLTPFILISGLFIAIPLSGCSSQTQFVKKGTQTAKQFAADQSYCRSQAIGQNNDAQGVSTMHLRLKTSGNISYEDCMRGLGYSEYK